MKLISPAAVLYVALILAVNIGFSYVPMIETSFGLFSPMAILVGVVFIARDFAQRQIGHSVLIYMVIGTALSFLLADPFVAVASATAFAISELTDWLLYTVTKRPFKDRVLLSSAISTPVDTAVFLGMISGLTTGTFILMVLSKLAAAAFVWFYYYGNEKMDEHLIDGGVRVRRSNHPHDYRF
jgi:uncharacterized PurR-regulated membrane protein YhhQ (DUF165 family)